MSWFTLLPLQGVIYAMPHNTRGAAVALPRAMRLLGFQPALPCFCFSQQVYGVIVRGSAKEKFFNSVILDKNKKKLTMQHKDNAISIRDYYPILA